MRIVFRLFLLLLCEFSISSVGASESGSASSGRWITWSEKPSSSWENAFVTGNGRHGTMVLGNLQNERIVCVHEELFIRGWDPAKVTVPVTADLIPKVRQLMEEGKSDAASALLTNEADRQLRGMGAFQRWPLIPHPAFDLCIKDWKDTSTEFTHYRRQLNLETGEALVCKRDVKGQIEEAVFSSRVHDVNVIRLKASRGKKINIMLSLEETPGREGNHFEHNLDNSFRSVNSNAVPGWLMYRASYSTTPGGYDGLARVTLKGGRMTVEGQGLKIEDAEEVLVVIRITPLADGNLSDMPAVKKELSRLPDSYRQLLKPHSSEHGEMFRRMQLDFGCETGWKTTPTEKMLAEAELKGVTPLFLEQVHAMGRYLLISSCGKYPPPLQGIWGGGWKPAWIGGFVWDSNINLAISAASMSNLSECAETYCNYVESLLPGWRLNAKNYLGCRGFIVAHYNDPTNGYLTHFGSSFPWMFWAGGAGWNLRPFYEHAMLTGDKRFLQERVFPLYREMAEFYEDYLRMGDDSLYHIYPSVSPENAPVGTGTWLSKDATMDIAIAREVFTLLCQMGEEFYTCPEDIRKWVSYLERLPPYRINEDGALAEWVDENYADIYNHRHNSHLYPVFPGTELLGDDVDQGLRNAAGIALDKRSAFDTSSAHGLIHLALQAARLKDVDKVCLNLERFSKRRYLYDGLVTSHEPSHDIYNLDAVLSFPRLLMEMLVFTQPGQIEILPAWSNDYPSGTVKGMKIYGGHTLDMSWKNGKLTSLAIHGGSNEMLECSYQNIKRQFQLKNNRTYYWKL